MTVIPLREGRPESRCLACRKNQHVGCDHHINDGAFDAEDFVTVSCDCPCEGAVHDPGRGLIGLVADLRATLAALGRESGQRIETLQDDVREKTIVIRELQAALAEKYDDEGNPR